MKKSVAFALAVLSTSVTIAATNELDLGTGDSLLMTTPQTLLVKNTPASSAKPAVVTVTDTNGICQLRLMFRMLQTIPTKDDIKTGMVASGSRLLANSEESSIEVKEIPNKNMTLLYFELTDKRQDAGDGRFMLQGAGTDGKKYVLQFMVLSKQKDSLSKTQILEVLSTLTIEKKK